MTWVYIIATTRDPVALPGPPSTLLISCGALAREIITIIRSNSWDHMQVKCLPAHLHNDPEKIPEEVRKRIRENCECFDQIFVLFSDCGTGGLLDKVLKEEGVEPIFGNHCYEVYSGTCEFEQLVAAEPASFFLTDFLVRHFKRLIIEGMGIDRHPQLLDIFFGKYKRLVYLAQKPDSLLATKAEEAAQRLGLDLDIRITGYGGYESFLKARAN